MARTRPRLLRTVLAMGLAGQPEGMAESAPDRESRRRAVDRAGVGIRYVDLMGNSKSALSQVGSKAALIESGTIESSTNREQY